jgi:hypothetical protein
LSSYGNYHYETLGGARWFFVLALFLPFFVLPPRFAHGIDHDPGLHYVGNMDRHTGHQYLDGNK